MTGTRPSKGRRQEHLELLRAQGSREIAWSTGQPSGGSALRQVRAGSRRYEVWGRGSWSTMEYRQGRGMYFKAPWQLSHKTMCTGQS